LLAELEEMEQEELDNELIGMNNPTTLPDIPAASLPTPGTLTHKMPYYSLATIVTTKITFLPF